MHVCVCADVTKATACIGGGGEGPEGYTVSLAGVITKLT